MGVRPTTLSDKVVRGSPNFMAAFLILKRLALTSSTAASMTLGSWHLYFDGAIVDAEDI